MAKKEKTTNVQIPDEIQKVPEAPKMPPIEFRLLQLQGANITVPTNQSREENGVLHEWADLGAILTVLKPMLQSQALLLTQGLEGESVYTKLVAIGSGEVMKQTYPLGQVNSNNEFSARFTTIRRDMIAAMFGIIIEKVTKKQPNQQPTTDTPVDNQPSKSFAKAISLIETITTMEAVETIKKSIQESAKLQPEEKVQLFNILAEKMNSIIDGPTIE